MRRTSKPHQLHIPCNRNAHVCRELPMKVIRREVGDAAQGIHRQVAFKVAVDIGKHGFEPFCVGRVVL